MNHYKCTAHLDFLNIYGITQHPLTEEYMIVMQYANNGHLMSYLDQNINKLTWKMKLQYLEDIAHRLHSIHNVGLVHCDLHGGNIIMDGRRDDDDTYLSEPYICDLGLSQSNLCNSNSTIHGVLAYVAPEVLRSFKFTQKSDIYAFGIVMYHMASGVPPFRDRQFDEYLATDICNVLRPIMPDSAPEPYRDLGERCCDADPGKRPTTREVVAIFDRLVKETDNDESGDNVW